MNQSSRTLRIDRFGSALFAALGLVPLVGCGSSVDETGTGGSGSGGAGPSTTTEATGTNASTGGGVNPWPCEAPAAVVVDGIDTGFDLCAGGNFRRRTIQECPSLVPRDGETCNDGGVGSCTTDAECPGTNAYCATYDFEGGCGCQTGCTSDAECGVGNICLCGDPIGRCVSATCTSDADCGGLECRSWDQSGGCGSVDFTCQAAADACGADSDCESGLCMVGEDGVRACDPGGCAIGRPFLVDEVERVAEIERRGDWRQSYASGAVMTPDVESVPPALRADLAARWTRIAQMEHASIAAFARFALQLLAVGAPPDLIERTNKALADETSHARAAFAVASAYAGRPIGPGKLELRGALDDVTDLAAIVRLVIREGCVGETVAAIEANEAEGRCNDVVVRSLLGRIAEEEGQHAELAWRTVRWAMSVGGLEVREVVADELARLQAEVDVLPPPTTTSSDEALLEWGVATDALRAALRSSAIERVVVPGLAAVLAETGRQAA